MSVKTSCSTSHTPVKPASTMINLDSVSLESDHTNDQYKPQTIEPQKNITLSTFQNTELSLLLPSSESSSSSSGSCSGSSQFLQDIKTLDEKYSLVSSTPSVNTLDKRMGRFKTFSESTLLESISETDSELHRMSEEYNSNLRKMGPLSSLGGSTTFSVEERLAEHSFEHFSHNEQCSSCMCPNSHCHNNQNSTFII